MKTRLIYPLVMFIVVALIGTCAWLTHVLFGLSIPNKSTDIAMQTVNSSNESPVVAEIKIESTAPSKMQQPVKQEKMDQPKTQEPAKTAKTEKQEGIGTVTIVRGNAFAVNSGEQRRQLVENSRVFINEKIETESGARIQIQFDDNSKILQGENSVIVINEYVYNPEQKDNACFGMRFIKGACRIVTGLITDLNPNRFHVRTRMASIGIRGCDLSFRTSDDQDDIYVLDLSGQKTVRIDTTSNGSPMFNALTGAELSVDPAVRKTIDVTEPQKSVSVIKGQGVTEKSISPEEIRGIISATSHMAPVGYDFQQTPNKVHFTLRPLGEEGNNPDQTK